MCVINSHFKSARLHSGLFVIVCYNCFRFTLWQFGSLQNENAVGLSATSSYYYCFLYRVFYSIFDCDFASWLVLSLLQFWGKHFAINSCRSVAGNDAKVWVLSYSTFSTAIADYNRPHCFEMSNHDLLFFLFIVLKIANYSNILLIMN